MGWMVQGLNPGRGKSLSSKHQTSSEAHPTSYSMGIRGNYPKGLAAVWCWTLNVSSCEIKNKWSHSSTPPKWPSFHGPDWFVVNCVRSLIPKDSGVLLKCCDFVYPSSKPLLSKLTQSNLDFTSFRASFKINIKWRKWKFIFKTYFL
jgi:hypothetical protein